MERAGVPNVLSTQCRTKEKEKKFNLENTSYYLSVSVCQFNSIQGLYWHGKHVLTLPKQVR
jgi:hypothetical protein